MINNTLVFTENNWNTASTAVGKIAVGYNPDGSVKYSYGINGQVLIGELILGNNLFLTGTGAGIKIKDSSGNDAFYADDDGNLILSGTIYADFGEIAGWSIEPTQITKVVDIGANNSRRVSLCSDSSSPAFFVTASDAENSLFKVNWDGSVNATSGSLGGWTFTQDYFYKTIGEYSIAFGLKGIGGTNRVFKIGKFKDITGAWGDFEEGCSINGQGQLRATGAIISGNITAGEGKIGGWSISNNGLETFVPNVGRIRINSSSSTRADNWIEITTSDWNDASIPFKVTRSGVLHATGAVISGTINANEGHFGVWQIAVSRYGGQNAIVADDGYNYVSLSPQGVYYVNADGGGDMFREWRQILVTASDRRLKNSIEYIVSHNNLDAFFNSLKPCTYFYKNGYALGDVNELHIGFVAQDIQESANNFDIQKFSGLSENFREGCLGLNYHEFIALNTWQIQRCKKRIVDLENTVAELKTQIQTLTAG